MILFRLPAGVSLLLLHISLQGMEVETILKSEAVERHRGGTIKPEELRMTEMQASGYQLMLNVIDEENEVKEEEEDEKEIMMLRSHLAVFKNI